MAGAVILGGMSRAGQQNGQEMRPQTAQIARKPGTKAPTQASARHGSHCHRAKTCIQRQALLNVQAITVP